MAGCIVWNGVVLNSRTQVLDRTVVIILSSVELSWAVCLVLMDCHVPLFSSTEPA